MVTEWLVRSQLSAAVHLGGAEADVVCQDVAAYVRRARTLAPYHIRIGIALLQSAFAVLLALSLYPAPETRRGARLLSFWSALPHPAPSLIRFYASLTALRGLEHETLMREFGFSNPTVRADAKRRERAALGGEM